MPRRGYRKGIDDAKEALIHPTYTRLSAADKAALMADARSRAIDAAKLIRQLVKAHLKGTRAALPHKRGPSTAAIRELARIGNNLNQLTRTANTHIVPLDVEALRAVLAEVNAAARRLG